MTKAEFIEMTKAEFIEKYESAPVKFSHYNKFKFYYAGTVASGETITLAVGGDSDDIYRLDVDADKMESVVSLDPVEGHVYFQDGTIESFFDY